MKIVYSKLTGNNNYLKVQVQMNHLQRIFGILHFSNELATELQLIVNNRTFEILSDCIELLVSFIMTLLTRIEEAGVRALDKNDDSALKH